MSDYASFTGNTGGQLPETYIVPANFNDGAYHIATYLNNISYAVNRKDSGYYDANPTITGQQFLPTYSTSQSSSTVYRPVLRVVVDTGALPNATTSTTAHNISGISSTWSATKIYGAATDPSTPAWLPLPYASPTLADTIAVDVDATNVTITTGSNRTAYTRSFVVIEYIQTT